MCIRDRLRMNLYESWKAKNLPELIPNPEREMSWFRTASLIKDNVIAEGHGSGSRILFVDEIPGPCVLEAKPGQVEAQYNEMAELRRARPDVDWPK